jgi:hypothetical protein
MTNFAKVISFACLALLVNSCSLFDSSDRSLDFIPAKVEKGENWGMLGPDGKMLFSDEFENMPSAVINGYFTVDENDGVSVYKADAKPELVKGLDNLKAAGFYTEGLIPIVRPLQRIEFVNSSGKTKFTLEPVDKKEIVGAASSFHNGLCLIVNEDGNVGAIDTKGNVVIKPSFDGISPFNEGYALATKINEEKGIQYFIIDKKGENVVKLKEEMTPISSQVKYGKFMVKYKDHCGYVDMKGEFTKFPSKVEGVADYNDKYYIYKSSDGDYGVMDFNDEIIVRAKYYSIRFFGDKFMAGHNKNCYIIDTKGDIEKTIDDVPSFAVIEGFGAFLNDNGSYVLYNEKGEQVGKETFETLSLNDSDDLIVSDYFDANGLVEKLLNYVEDGGIAGVKVGGAVGSYLDKDNLQQYSYGSYIDLENKVEGGYRYDLALRVMPSESVVSKEPVYTTINTSYAGYPFSYDTFDHYDYKINQDSKVKAVGLIVSAEVDFFKDAFDKVTKGLSNKGFKEQNKTEQYYYATRGTDGIIVCTEGGVQSMTIVYFKTSDASEIVRHFGDSQAILPDADDVAVAVEEGPMDAELDEIEAAAEAGGYGI